MSEPTIDKCQLSANSLNLDFSWFRSDDIPAVAGMDALAGDLQADQEVEDTCKENGSDNKCNKHSMPYDFWTSTKNEFYCKGCAAENPHVKLELIQDALPQVKATLAVEVPIVKKEVESHLQSLDDMHAEFMRQRKSVIQFMKAVQTQYNKLEKCIDQIVAFKSKVLGTVANLKKLERKVDSINSTADLHVAVECLSTMEEAAVRCISPGRDLTQTLLFSIAFSYVEETETKNHPSKASFVNAIVMGCPQPQLQIVRTAEKLMNDIYWTVDNNNFEAVLLALADKQPRTLTLIERDDGLEALPVAALAKAAKNCEIYAKFVDTFYSAPNTATDTERLEHLLASKSDCLRSFHGHLDHSAIAKLPHTVNRVGLAIGSAADAAAVSGLKTWKGLDWMGTSKSKPKNMLSVEQH